MGTVPAGNNKDVMMLVFMQGSTTVNTSSQTAGARSNKICPSCLCPRASSLLIANSFGNDETWFSPRETVSVLWVLWGRGGFAVGDGGTSPTCGTAAAALGKNGVKVRRGRLSSWKIIDT